MYLAGGRLFPAGTAEQDVAGAGDTFRMIGAAWAGVAALLIVVFAALRARASRRAKIVATGIPGTALPIGVDRENPDDFEIVWDELPVPGSQLVAAYA